jgi:hypothetical protein
MYTVCVDGGEITDSSGAVLYNFFTDRDAIMRAHRGRSHQLYPLHCRGARRRVPPNTHMDEERECESEHAPSCQTVTIYTVPILSGDARRRVTSDDVSMLDDVRRRLASVSLDFADDGVA